MSEIMDNGTSWQAVRVFCDSVVFCALHDQLASLGRHVQLTRCFSAVAELLVFTAMMSVVKDWSVTSQKGSNLNHSDTVIDRVVGEKRRRKQE